MILQVIKVDIKHSKKGDFGATKLMIFYINIRLDKVCKQVTVILEFKLCFTAGKRLSFSGF